MQVLAWRVQPLLWPVTPVLPIWPSSENSQVRKMLQSDADSVDQWKRSMRLLALLISCLFWDVPLSQPLVNHFLLLQRRRSPCAGQGETEKRQPQSEWVFPSECYFPKSFFPFYFLTLIMCRPSEEFARTTYMHTKHNLSDAETVLYGPCADLADIVQLLGGWLTW